MGSLLKLQYQVNMNIETLLQETQIVYHAPDFDHAQPFLDKAFTYYKETYCANGRGGSFVQRDRQARRFRRCGDHPPEDSVVLKRLNRRKIRRNLAFLSKEFMNDI